MTLKSGLDKRRSNSLSTRGCGESRQIESLGLGRLVATFDRVGKTGRVGKELWGRCSRTVTDHLDVLQTAIRGDGQASKSEKADSPPLERQCLLIRRERLAASIGSTGFDSKEKGA